MRDIIASPEISSTIELKTNNMCNHVIDIKVPHSRDDDMERGKEKEKEKLFLCPFYIKKKNISLRFVICQSQSRTTWFM